MILVWWQKLSVSKKLYCVVGAMAMLIVVQLVTFIFAMRTLSAVRGFVGGEGFWSKAQKNSVYYLHNYISTHDENQYKLFLKQIKIPLGDHQARNELQKENMDRSVVVDGFLKGGNSPEDIPKMIFLVRHFSEFPLLSNALEKWKQGDELFFKYIKLGKKIHSLAINKNSNPLEIEFLMGDVLALDRKLTQVENDFSFTLGEASRKIESILMMFILFIVITVKSIGIYLTIKFSKTLKNILFELNESAIAVGQGNFNKKVPIRSKDELGELAISINTMIDNLDLQIKQKENAENSSQTKNLFLANMSHEMRTPLNAILGFSNILTDPNLSEKERVKYNEIIKRTGSSLNMIINDVLDIAKVEAQEINLEVSDFSLSQLMSDLYAMLNLRTEGKSVSLKFNRIGEVSEFIQCDPNRLKQIISNIVGNAIKFTSKGGINLSYQVDGELLRFDIEDTGPGISLCNQKKLFKTFSQADSSVSKKFGGTGLGLVIAKKLSELLGGDCVLTRSDETGSLFTITIKYIPVESKVMEMKSINSEQMLSNKTLLEGKKILVAEDSMDNQLLIQLFLSKTGVQLEFVENGQEVVDKLKTNSYDLIMMDMQMPVVDGFTATKMAREFLPNIPIIALTGYAMKEDKDRCIEVGCNAYLSKPFEKVELITSISEILKV